MLTNIEHVERWLNLLGSAKRCDYLSDCHYINLVLRDRISITELINATTRDPIAAPRIINSLLVAGRTLNVRDRDEYVDQARLEFTRIKTWLSPPTAILRRIRPELVTNLPILHHASHFSFGPRGGSPPTCDDPTGVA